MTIPRTVYKMHATGNDFVVYADPEGTLEPNADQVRWLCDRHFGIGADGLIRLTHPGAVSDLSEEIITKCDQFGCQWFMDYRNADGSLAQMCGNGTRAATLFAQKQGLAPTLEGSSFLLGTRVGVKRIVSLSPTDSCGRHLFTVNMGSWQMGELGGQTVRVGLSDQSAPGTLVDMGNPHVVVLLEARSLGNDVNQDAAMTENSSHRISSLLSQSTLPDLGDLDLDRQPQVDPGLDQGVNVEFIGMEEVDAHRGHASMRVYERGVGETLSCGTGLSASGVVLRALTGQDHWLIRVGGGTLSVDLDERSVRLTGEARMVARLTLEDIPQALV